MRTLLFLLVLALPLTAKDIPVADPAALQAALTSAQPGDRLILREGEWRDAKIVFAGRGTKRDALETDRAHRGGDKLVTKQRNPC